MLSIQSVLCVHGRSAARWTHTPRMARQLHYLKSFKCVATNGLVSRACSLCGNTDFSANRLLSQGKQRHSVRCERVSVEVSAGVQSVHVLRRGSLDRDVLVSEVRHARRLRSVLKPKREHDQEAECNEMDGEGQD